MYVSVFYGLASVPLRISTGSLAIFSHFPSLSNLFPMHALSLETEERVHTSFLRKFLNVLYPNHCVLNPASVSQSLPHILLFCQFKGLELIAISGPLRGGDSFIG